jgi:hypothetical protein
MHIKKLLTICILVITSSAVGFTGTLTNNTVNVFVGNLPALTESAASWADFNNDGFWDLAVCGKDASGNPKTYLYENIKISNQRRLSLISNSLLHVFRGDIEWFDYNNDGNIDLIITGDTGNAFPQTKIFKNDGKGSFSDSGIMLPGALNSAIAVGDYNNDGNLDVAIVGETSVAKIFKNTGGAFVDSGINISTSSKGDLQWADLNNDGWIDLIQTGIDPVNPASIFSAIYQNTRGTLTKTGSLNANESFNGDIKIADYDNDGDLDIALNGGTDQSSDKQVVGKIYENISASTDTISFSTHTFIPELSYGALAWGDTDNDGNLDLAAQGAFLDLSDLYHYQLNTLSPIDSFTVNTDTLTADLSRRIPQNGSASFVDYDNDRDLDLFVTGITFSGNPFAALYTNDEADSSGNNNPNNIPPVVKDFDSFYLNGKLYIAWNDPVASVAETPADGLYYNFRVGNNSADDDLVPARYGSPLLGNYITKVTSSTIDDVDIATGTIDISQYKHVRVLNVAGKSYYWAVQTIDSSLGRTWGSSFETGWSQEQFFADPTGPNGIAETPLDEGLVTYSKNLTFFLSQGTSEDPETGIFGCFLELRETDLMGNETIIKGKELSENLTEQVWDTDGNAKFTFTGDFFKTYSVRIKPRHGYDQSVPTTTYRPDLYGTPTDPDGLFNPNSPHYVLDWSEWSDGIQIVKLLLLDKNVIRKPGDESDALQIKYKTVIPGNVKIRIFDILGELVQTILDEDVNPGEEKIEKWLGTNDDGEIVGTGVYYVNIQASGKEDTQKTIVIK